jgi:hypothetical protein
MMQQTPDSPTFQPPARQRIPGRHKVLLALTAVIIVASGTYRYIQWRDRFNPQGVFDEMLGNSLQLESYRMKTSITDAYGTGGPLTIQADVVDSGDSVDASAGFTDGNEPLQLRMAMVQNGSGRYAKIDKYPIQVPLNPDIAGRWAKLEQPPGAAAHSENAYTAAMAAIHSRTGEVPMGNFDKAGRKAVLSLIRDRHIYEEVRPATRFKDNGAEVYRYEVKVSLDNLEAMNKAVANHADENYGYLEDLYRQREETRLLMDVNASTKELVRVEVIDDDGKHTVTEYSAHNTELSLQEPKDTIPAASLGELMTRIGQ